MELEASIDFTTVELISLNYTPAELNVYSGQNYYYYFYFCKILQQYASDEGNES